MKYTLEQQVNGEWLITIRSGLTRKLLGDPTTKWFPTLSAACEWLASNAV